MAAGSETASIRPHSKLTQPGDDPSAAAAEEDHARYIEQKIIIRMIVSSLSRKKVLYFLSALG